MKKYLILLLLSYQVTSSKIALAQSRQFFQFEFKDQRSPSNSELSRLSIPDTALYQIDNFMAPKDLKSMAPKTPILLGIRLQPSGSTTSRTDINSIDKVYSAYFITDNAQATVVALGINDKNVGDYQYRVVENDSIEITPWSKIPKLAKGFGAKTSYGFIGDFRAPGKQLLVEIKNIKNYDIRDGVIFDWRKDFKPVLKQVNVLLKINDTLFSTVLKDDQYKQGLTKIVDPITNIPVNFNFKDGLVRHIILYFNSHETIPYEIFVHRIVDGKSQGGEFGSEFTTDSKMVSFTEFDYPGKYEIVVSRSKSIGKSKEKDLLKIPFEVLPGIDRSQSPPLGLLILLAIIVILLGLLIFTIYYRRNRTRLEKLKQEEQTASLKLKSIRSQLNPHFMFNALSSIQNLINKNNITDANFYLSKFAGLTRQVLDSNNENMISLDDELRMLTDYLEMEQLRFNFRFEIVIDPLLNQANIEVPAMLVQPFIENAVKHGVSGLKQEGLIQIIIKGLGTDLEMKVQDNGGGYDQNECFSGYGIKLSEERIELLNQLYKGQSVSLSTTSTSKGTTIIIRLSNWIS